ncbi:MAG: hypothetical protein QM278_06220 [Pseudomonadota bacterium]|nr:hypothetical protein [Pseudomonadota bacterium]
MLASPATLEEAYHQAYEERRIARRELKIMGEVSRLPKGVTRAQTDHARRDSVMQYASVRLEAKRRILERKVIPLGEIRGKESGK